MVRLANFCGAYLENGFSEDQNTVIYLKTGADASPAVPEATGLESLSNVAPPALPAAQARWPRTKTGRGGCRRSSPRRWPSGAAAKESSTITP